MPSTALKILIVDDEANIRRTLKMCLEADGHQVATASSFDTALTEAAKQDLDIAFIDLRLGTASGLDLIPRLLAQNPWLKIVVITAYGSIDIAVDAMKRGAADFLTKPFAPKDIMPVVERLGKLQRPMANGAESHEPEPSEPAAVFESSSRAMQQAVAMARQIAASNASVLIRGESGTGKGVLAAAIHGWSERAGRPFAVVSCPSLSPQLLESEMFGHAQGAFTGAVRQHDGRVAAADGGTLFLDEIGELPLALQPKLLRFLQDRRYERVGEAVTRRADVRVIAATNEDLEAAVPAGRFREDLLYRLNVVQITLPPLRSRPEDIELLAQRMLAFFARGKRLTGFTPEALAALRANPWRGNLRELRNVIERAVILSPGEVIGVEQLPSPAANELKVGDSVSMERVEEAHIREVLKRSKSLTDAAQTLGMDPATLWRKRRRYQI